MKCPPSARVDHFSIKKGKLGPAHAYPHRVPPLNTAAGMARVNPRLVDEVLEQVSFHVKDQQVTRTHTRQQNKPHSHEHRASSGATTLNKRSRRR